MKRIIALLLALCLLLAAAALAEEEAIVVENKPSYKGEYAAIGDTGLSFYLPDDWQGVAAPDEVDGEVYASPDSQIILTVAISEGDFEATRRQYAALVQDGTLAESVVMNINGADWLLSVTADNLQNYAQTRLDEENLLNFVFVVASPSIEPEEMLEMAGSLTADD